MTIYWPNDRAHCDRADCPKAQQCARFMALQDKRDREADLSRVVFYDFKPENCEGFVFYDFKPENCEGFV